jgi:hypothetical protein
MEKQMAPEAYTALKRKRLVNKLTHFGRDSLLARRGLAVSAFLSSPPGGLGCLLSDSLLRDFSMSSSGKRHHGDCCTFESLIDRFGIRDRAVQRLAELIHDADLEDDKFHRVEGFGVERIFKGWSKQGMSDQEILSEGFRYFDGLYAEFKRS